MRRRGGERLRTTDDNRSSRMKAPALAKAMCPPALLGPLRRLTGRGMRFDGRPPDWTAALQASSGYADPTILQRVQEASRRVLRGEASYERDSVTFSEPALPFHLLAGLLRSAAMDEGRLHVVDVGGALGSIYRQCRPFLAAVPRLDWQVVEQPSFAEAGRREFQTNELRFHASLAEVGVSDVPATFLLSGVLQYLEQPHGLLDELGGLPARHLIIDRTPISAQSQDRLCIQHAARRVYRASYPCWIFSRERLMERLNLHWKLLSDELCPEAEQRTTDGLSFTFRSLLLERRA